MRCREHFLHKECAVPTKHLPITWILTEIVDIGLGSGILVGRSRNYDYVFHGSSTIWIVGLDMSACAGSAKYLSNRSPIVVGIKAHCLIRVHTHTDVAARVSTCSGVCHNNNVQTPWVNPIRRTVMGVSVVINATRKTDRVLRDEAT